MSRPEESGPPMGVPRITSSGNWFASGGLAARFSTEAGSSSDSPDGVPRRYSNTENSQPFVASQAHLLRATTENPQPTAVPPPIAANAGTLGVRHVLCIIGLPERGKPYIARRLQSYLSFFHGAEVQIFNLQDYQRSEPGSDENADAVLRDLRAFMSKDSSLAANNMNVSKRQSGLRQSGLAENSEGSGLAESSVKSSADQALDSDSIATELLVDNKDPRRKNVDSGKVAIIMSTDSHASFKEKWAGTSKERRQWAAQTLVNEKRMNAKLIYIEVIVNKPELIEANIKAKRSAQGLGETSVASLRDHNLKVKQYSRMYVTLQDDGSEDDLSYIKLYNYGGKVVTNRMHGYLRMRIAQFLTVIHTTPHVIYLSRHGQSEYNVLGKIGGNPPLSDAGAEYARRLGEWAPQHIQRDAAGRPVKCRLWTSSLQRTILTAEHIPHPAIPLKDFDDELVELVGHSIPPSAAPAMPPSAAEGTPPGEAASPPGGAASPSAAKMPSSPLHLPNPAPFVPTPVDGMGLDGGAGVMRGSRRLSRDEIYSHVVTSGTSPPPELVDADYEGVWEQMSPRVYRNLDEIFAGEYEGKTYEEIKRAHATEASLRAMDKIGYRYPRGESYFDILSRLDPLVHEMESYHEPLLIVSHQAVLRVLYSYLMGRPRAGAPKIEIPLHTIMKITYDGWNAPREERFWLGPEPPTCLDRAPDNQDGQKNL